MKARTSSSSYLPAQELHDKNLASIIAVRIREGARFRREKRKYSQTRTVTVPQHVGDAEKNFTSPPLPASAFFSAGSLPTPLPCRERAQPERNRVACTCNAWSLGGCRGLLYPLVKSRNRTSLTHTHIPNSYIANRHQIRIVVYKTHMQPTTTLRPSLSIKGSEKHLALPNAVVVEAIQPISQTRIRPNRPNHVISHPALKI